MNKEHQLVLSSQKQQEYPNMVMENMLHQLVLLKNNLKAGDLQFHQLMLKVVKSSCKLIMLEDQVIPHLTLKMKLLHHQQLEFQKNKQQLKKDNKFHQKFQGHQKQMKLNKFHKIIKHVLNLQNLLDLMVWKLLQHMVIYLINFFSHVLTKELINMEEALKID